MLQNIIARPFASQFAVRNFHATALALSYPTGKGGRPLTAYIRFVQETRPSLVKKEPSLTLPETGKRLGELWRGLPESQREEYKREYVKAYSEYKSKQGNQ